jgi:hypothetical protein
MPIRRLTAEAVRDAMLAVSGRLDTRQFGPSPMVYIPDFMRSNRSPAGNGPLDGDGRRSIYIEGRRNHPDTFLAAFDKPTPFTANGLRNVSNSPAQPLVMLNSPLAHGQAELWAERLLGTGKSDAELVETAYAEAFARPPTGEERAAAAEFLGAAGERKAAWADLCHTLFNVKEFMFLN